MDRFGDEGKREERDTHLKDTVGLDSIDSKLSVLARPEDLLPVRRARCTRPYCAVRGLNGGERRRLQTLRDVDMLQLGRKYMISINKAICPFNTGRLTSEQIAGENAQPIDPFSPLSSTALLAVCH